MATVLSDDGEWIYQTYFWPETGVVSYGVSNGQIVFPGDMLAVWEQKE